jgi:hypothetical protein
MSLAVLIRVTDTALARRGLAAEDGPQLSGTQLGIFATTDLEPQTHGHLQVYGFCGPSLTVEEEFKLDAMRWKWSTIECPDPLGQGYRSAWLFGPAARLNASTTRNARLDRRTDHLPRAVLFKHHTGEYDAGGGWS